MFIFKNLRKSTSCKSINIHIYEDLFPFFFALFHFCTSPLLWSIKNLKFYFFFHKKSLKSPKIIMCEKHKHQKKKLFMEIKYTETI